MRKTNILNNAQIIFLITYFGNCKKIQDFLIKQEYGSLECIEILKKLNIKKLIRFLSEQKKFLEEKKISIYQVTKRLDIEKQREIIVNLENMNLTLSEKKEILVTLNKKLKREVDKSVLSPDCRKAIELNYGSTKFNFLHDSLEIDLDTDLENYEGLDKLICELPIFLEEGLRKRFIKLCKICPNLKVFDKLDGMNFSTGKEYILAEEWIESIINKIKPEYLDLQKIAIIDYEIGKKISYSSDFGTEIYDDQDARAIWKIISSGYGVCEGISKVEQYILRRIGIESKLIFTDNHVFLEIKDIEILTENGNIEKGDTIIDPTCNKYAHLFNLKPGLFCVSYQKAREKDIDSMGRDSKSHKNDNELRNTIQLSEEGLMYIFKSIGLLDKDGNFLIESYISKSKLISKQNMNNPKRNVEEQFKLLKEICPYFALHFNETKAFILNILLNSYKCNVGRVYNKNDEEKKTIMYVYIDLDELGRMFYIADPKKMEMIELSEKQFTEQYKCYSKDLEKNNRKSTVESKY